MEGGIDNARDIYMPPNSFIPNGLPPNMEIVVECHYCHESFFAIIDRCSAIRPCSYCLQPNRIGSVFNGFSYGKEVIR